ncbi:MAG TPA: hypothetical protein ENK07_08755 [Bacteroidetes bacterium]|nr:hypothetical protein [Bacteroidota bacterium]
MPEESSISAESREQEQVYQMGLAARLANFFLGSTSKAVGALKERASWQDWVIPILVTFLVTAAFGRLTKDIVITEVKQKIATSTKLTEEQQKMILDRIEQQQEVADKPTYLLRGYAISLVSILVVTVVVAGILMFLINVVLGGNARFIHALALASWGSWLAHLTQGPGTLLIGLFPAILKTPLILAKGTTDVATSLAVLLPAGMKGQFLYALATKVDLFNLWQLGVMSVGVAVLAGTSTKKAAGWVVGTWVVWAILASALAALLKGPLG